MAAGILHDIFNNFLSVECLLNWLSNKSSTNEEEVFLNKYECSQIEFVSYFLNFIRWQCSRDFQVYDAETPRKTSHIRMIKDLNSSANKSSPEILHNSSLNASHLDLESLQLFPTLSSHSSKTDYSESKLSKCTPVSQSDLNTSRDLSDKKFRRVKLFSETVEGVSKSNRKDIEFLDDVEVKMNDERVVISTPKTTGNSSLAVADYFNSPDPSGEDSFSKSGFRSKWKNHSLTNSVSPEINSLAPKSRSFSGESNHRNRDQKVNCRMSLGDFFLNDMNSSDNKKEKKNKSRKRINPITVHPQQSVSTVDEKTNVLNNKFQILEDNVQLSSDITNSSCSKSSKPLKTMMAEQEADINLVTSTKELKILSQIYSSLINENYCQNIMMELCFIISLLVIQDYNKKNYNLEQELKDLSTTKDKLFFGSIHNCVYFAVETLWLQRNILLWLNLSALKLLSENVRIEKFNIKLKDFLVNAYSQRQATEEVKRQNGLMKSSMQGNVSFQYETDNRENFTSDASFHSFRKQRDLFYNILSVWQANHLVSGWLFSIGLGSKIRSLLSISSDPINLLHLARLFRNQLVMSCCAESQPQEEISEEIFQLLPSADPNKILRLRARLTSSPKRQGLCPVPDFTGHQEFYKDFILFTSNSPFHEHLKNSLCDEILRLNDTELTGDMDDEDTCLDEQAQERYLQCTNVLRLLAKFLGFVEFLPYRGEKPLSDRIVNIHCSVRHNTLPLFDVDSCLKSALKRQKLTLTIPWIVSYLSMIDPYSAHLKTYQNVWRFLIMLYKHLKTFKSVKNSFYLKLALGWIFQLPNFPSDQFYTILDEYHKNSQEFFKTLQEDQTKSGLDSYDFIEETVLYTVFPFLNEINVILNENVECNVKHIRPVTTQQNFFTKSQASKQLELRLESNFLHNQSSSTRKTLEFVTERVASIAIKHLIYNVIPNIKEECWKDFNNLFLVSMKETESKAEALAESCYQKLLISCENESWEVSSKRAEMALKALLSNDLQGSISETCTKIITRQATEKVQRWTQSHVTLAMIKKEFVSLARKKMSKKLSDQNNTLDSSETYPNQRLPIKNPTNTGSKEIDIRQNEVWPASQALKTARDLIWKITEGNCYIEELQEFSEAALNTILYRNDVSSAAKKTLFFLLVDLIVMFCVHSSTNVCFNVLNKFFAMTRSLDPQVLSHSSLERIVCPRNVAMILNVSKNKEKSWQNLGNFLLELLEEKLLSREQIETQLLSLLRFDWGKGEGIQLLKFISHIHGKHSRKHGLDKFTLLLEYIMDVLKDDESRSDYFD